MAVRCGFGVLPGRKEHIDLPRTRNRGLFSKRTASHTKRHGTPRRNRPPRSFLSSVATYIFSPTAPRIHFTRRIIKPLLDFLISKRRPRGGEGGRPKSLSSWIGVRLGIPENGSLVQLLSPSSGARYSIYIYIYSTKDRVSLSAW